MESATAAPGSLTDYTRSFTRNEHEWLHDFLQQTTDTNPGSENFEISIIDIINNTSPQIQTLRPSSDVQQIPAFLQTLNEEPSDSKARILLVSYKDMEYIKPWYLNAIGWTYKINPTFFEYHFSVSYHRDYNQKWRKGNIPTPLPSQVTYLQILYDSFSHITMFTGRFQDRQIIVILEHKYWILEAGGFKQMLLSDSALDTQTHSFEPAWTCVYPYIYSSLSKFAGFCSFHTWSCEGTMTGNSNLFRNVLATSTSHQKELAYSMENLARFLARQGFPEDTIPGEWRDVLYDYKVLISQTERTNTEIQAYLQAVQSMDAINETKLASRQADSVRRLTFVAFVFIPLSFACSFFGMNIKQLDAGTVNIGYFFLLAFLSALLAYIISASIKPAEEAMGRARERFAEREFCNDADSMITARRIFWKWMTRKIPLLKKLDEEWDVAESESFTWVQILWPFCCEIGRGIRSRLKGLGSRKADGNQGSPEEG